MIRRPKSSMLNARGVSLGELLITMAIMATTAAGVFSFMSSRTTQHIVDYPRISNEISDTLAMIRLYGRDRMYFSGVGTQVAKDVIVEKGITPGTDKTVNVFNRYGTLNFCGVRTLQSDPHKVEEVFLLDLESLEAAGFRPNTNLDMGYELTKIEYSPSSTEASELVKQKDDLKNKMVDSDGAFTGIDLSEDSSETTTTNPQTTLSSSTATTPQTTLSTEGLVQKFKNLCSQEPEKDKVTLTIEHNSKRKITRLHEFLEDYFEEGLTCNRMMVEIPAGGGSNVVNIQLEPNLYTNNC